MTPLAGEILKILEAEAAYPPMSNAKVIECLRVTGFGHGATVEEIEVALSELLAAGQVERVHSARLGARYRIAHNVQVGNVKAC